MRDLICGAIMAIAATIAATAQTSPPVPDAEVNALVDSVLQLPFYMDIGFNEHLGSLLGDRLAVAISKKVRLADLRTPEKAKRVLLLLRYAFANPTFVQSEADRNPSTTLLLLDFLEDQCPDPALRQRARELIIRIEALKSSLAPVVR